MSAGPTWRMSWQWDDPLHLPAAPPYFPQNSGSPAGTWQPPMQVRVPRAVPDPWNLSPGSKPGCPGQHPQEGPKRMGFPPMEMGKATAEQPIEKHLMGAGRVQPPSAPAGMLMQLIPSHMAPMMRGGRS